MRVVSLLGAIVLAITAPSVPVHALAINWDSAPKALPSVVMERPDGGDVGLDAYAGDVVVLNLWATWCAPCKREMPTLATLQAELAGDGVRVVALAVDRAEFSALHGFMSEAGAGQIEVLRDVDAAAARALNAPGLPVTIVVDREGRERFRHAGYADWSAPDVLDALRDLAAE